MPDLFDTPPAKPGDSYSAKDIEVLEGLEPVRRRPGMYIGGTDERGAASPRRRGRSTTRWTRRSPAMPRRIEIELGADGWVTVRDNGRGIPVDPHPRFPGQIGARSHPDDAAFRRQVRRRRLQDLGRPARRRRLGGQRALRRARGRGRARPPAVAPELLPRRSRRRSSRIAGRCRTGAARRCASIPTRRSSASSASGRRRSTAWRAPRPICSAASKSAGAATRRCRARTACRPRRGCISRAGSAISSRRASTAAPMLTPRPFRRPGRVSRKAAASNGRSPGPRTRRTGSAIPIATRSRRRRAARMRPGCAAR